VAILAIVVGAIYWGLHVSLYIPPDPPLSFLSSQEGLLFMILQDGRIMEYSEAGDPNGKPILCIQGTLQTGRSVCSLVHSFFLQKGFRAICPTLPGYGYTSYYDFTIPGYSKDISQLAKHLSITKFIAVVGWSGGGIVAASITSELPTLVDHLLLIVAAPPDLSWYDYPAVGHLYLSIAAQTRINELLIHFVVLPMLRKNCTDFFVLNTPPEEIELVKKHGTTFDFICEDMIYAVSHCERGYSSLAERWCVNTPIDWDNLSGKAQGYERQVTIIYGEKDNLITPSAALKYHEHIPGSKLYCKSGAGHMTGLAVSDFIGVLWGEKPILKKGGC